jgi:uncharacterized repeat protein (TIGR01451 family)
MAITRVAVDEFITGLTATSDSPVILGEVTTLTATLTAGSNISYTWDLGDGITLIGAVVAHTYPQTGTFSATVTAWNRVSDMTAATLVLVVETISQTADVQLDKQASASLVIAGDLLTYTLTVTNNGPLTATQVTLTDTLPAGVTVTQVTASQGTCTSSGVIVCSLGELPQGASAVVSLVVRVGTDMVGLIPNTAQVASAELDLHPANNTDSITVEVLSSGYRLYLPIVFRK